MGIIGAIYLGASVTYGVGTLCAGPLTDKLVRFSTYLPIMEILVCKYRVVIQVSRFTELVSILALIPRLSPRPAEK